MLRIYTSLLREKLIPKLFIREILSFEEYKRHTQQNREVISAISTFEKSLLPDHCNNFTLNGYCGVCNTDVDFMVDFKYAHKIDGILMPNWRERLVCPDCHMNNRMRAAVQIFDEVCHPSQISKIYITEQITALYQHFARSFPQLWGSEYLGNNIDFGSCNSDGVRNEDLTQLSFNDNYIDHILSFDVFEHIPNFTKAFEECYRCLKPGGTLLFTIPFNRNNEKNTIRATMSESGEIVHLLTPEYHGDPLSSDGCLCFYHFGWELIDILKSIGFKNTKALLYWSNDQGYLGGEQIIFLVIK